MEENLYSWSFPSKKDRGTTWYIIAMTVIISLVISGFLLEIYMMSFVVLLVSGLMFFVENNSADYVNVSINNLGISVDDKFYDFSGISSFGIVYTGKQAFLLRFRLKTGAIRTLDLYINNDIAQVTKNLLSQVLEERSKEELSLLERLSFILKI